MAPEALGTQVSPETRAIARLQAMLGDINKRDSNPWQWYGQVARECAELVNAETCSIWIIDRSLGRLFLAGEHGYGSTPRPTRGWPLHMRTDARELSYSAVGPPVAHEGVTSWVYKTKEDSRVSQRDLVN